MFSIKYTEYCIHYVGYIGTMYDLYIDTSDNKKLVVQVLKNENVVVEEVETENPKADQVLVVLGRIIEKAGVDIHYIKNVRVHKGPGSFTGVRVGVSIANALAFTLGIPVNNKKVGEIEVPEY